MVQVTGIEGLGKSLLDRQDEGFRRARRRNRRAQLIETGLGLAMRLGDKIFEKKYENYLKQEPVKIAERLAKRNTELRKSFQGIEDQAVANGMSVADFYRKKAEERFDDGFFSKIIPNWNTKYGPNNVPWINDESKIKLRQDLINHTLFGDDYAKADFNPENSTQGIYGNYLKAKRMLTAEPGEDFESSQDLFDEIKKSNPNAKSIGDALIRKITERGLTKEDRQSSSEAVIQSNTTTLRERNKALELFRQGLNIDTALNVAKKSEDFFKKYPLPAMRLINRRYEDKEHEVAGETITLRSMIETKVGKDGIPKEYKTFDTSDAETKKYVDTFGDATPVQFKEDRKNIWGEVIELTGTRIDGQEYITSKELKKLEIDPAKVSSKIINKAASLFSDSSIYQSPETKAVLTQLMPAATRSTSTTVQNQLSKAALQNVQVRALALGNLLTDAKRFADNYAPSDSEKVGLAFNILAAAKEYDEGALTDSDTLGKLLRKYHQGITNKERANIDYSDIDLNPFVVGMGVDRYFKVASIDTSNTKKIGGELYISFIKDPSNIKQIQSNFKNLSDDEKDHMFLKMKETRKDDESIFNIQIQLPTPIIVKEENVKYLEKAGTNVTRNEESGQLTIDTITLPYLLLGDEAYYIRKPSLQIL